MDLVLAGARDGYRLRPQSILGMVWLQTHFDDAIWDHLAAGRVQVSMTSAELLCQDAEAAGLRVTRTPYLPLPLGDRF